jgi:hypothetical protein
MTDPATTYIIVSPIPTDRAPTTGCTRGYGKTPRSKAGLKNHTPWPIRPQSLARENRSQIRKAHKVLLETPRLMKSFKSIYAKLSALRNDIDHSGFVEKPANSGDFAGRLEKLIGDVAAFIESKESEKLGGIDSPEA